MLDIQLVCHILQIRNFKLSRFRYYQLERSGQHEGGGRDMSPQHVKRGLDGIEDHIAD